MTYLDNFEPENPQLFIPRQLGLGWDLNMGAVAVRAGWIRPDDSLPDVADHIPQWLHSALRVALWIGVVAVGAGAVAVAKKKKAATGWTLTGQPRSFAPGPVAAIVPAVVPAIAVLLPGAWRKTTPAASISQNAQLLGAEVMSAGLLHAASHSSDEPTKRQPAALFSPLLWPLTAAAVQVITVKVALNQIDADLKAAR